jgi:hypothetical protein
MTSILVLLGCHILLVKLFIKRAGVVERRGNIGKVRGMVLT